MLQTLRHWAAEGWLRHLDCAFAALLAELQPAAPPQLLLAGALVANLEGQGHSCLDLRSMAAPHPALPGWPPEALQALEQALAGLPAGVEDWATWLADSRVVDVDAADGAGPTPAAGASAPLVLRGHRLYLRRYWRSERTVAAQVLERVRDASAERGGLHPGADLVRGWLDRLFDPPSKDTQGPDWQRLACAVALRGRLTVITGGPGTGKTYTAARLLALLLATSADPQRLRVGLAAPTGKAAARLGQSIGSALQNLQQRVGDGLPLASLVERIGPARTVHALLGARPDTRALRADAANPLPLDVLIVDEASMVQLELMAALMQALPAAARLVLLGDKDQLASVEAGSVLGDLCRSADTGQGGYTPDTAAALRQLTGQALPAEAIGAGLPLAQQTVQLRASRRFGGPIGQLAAAANAGDAVAAHALFDGAAGNAAHSLGWLPDAVPADAVALAVHGRGPQAPGFAGEGGYLQVLAQRPAASGDVAADRAAFEAWALRMLAAFDRSRVLCALREGPWGALALNLAIEQALAESGWLRRASPWFEGRPVMVTRNNAALGVFNGDIGIVVRAPAGPLAGSLRAVFSDGQGLRSVAVSRLEHAETAFAMTVHKSQGSEFGHTVLVLPDASNPVLTRELVYTGITRARSALTLVTGRRHMLAEALAQRTVRTSGLPELLGFGGR